MLARRLRGRPISDRRLLRRAPVRLAEQIEGLPIYCLEPSPQPKFHHIYAIGDQRMLHVYGSTMHPQLSRSVSDRWQLQSKLAIAGLPQLFFAEDDGELFWVLEQRLHGSNGCVADDEAWFAEAIDWLCRLAQLKGPPLRSTPFWVSHQREALECCGPESRSGLQAAWECIGGIESTPLHGDVQPKNIVFGPHGIGLIDWEGMWLYGLPGLDILFLATMSGNEVPAATVPDLLAGRPSARESLLKSALARCGYEPSRINAAMLVTLSIWTLGEAKRLQRDPETRRPSPFGDLLRQAAREFA